ncbi:MAG: hypothetical protein AABW79_03500 [Nanoarchaeota archaeon]
MTTPLENLEFNYSILKGVAGGLCTAAAVAFIVDKISDGNEIYRMGGMGVAACLASVCMCAFVYRAHKDFPNISPPREPPYTPPKKTSNFDP